MNSFQMFSSSNIFIQQSASIHHVLLRKHCLQKQELLCSIKKCGWQSWKLCENSRFWHYPFVQNRASNISKSFGKILASYNTHHFEPWAQLVNLKPWYPTVLTFHIPFHGIYMSVWKNKLKNVQFCSMASEIWK